MNEDTLREFIAENLRIEVRNRPYGNSASVVELQLRQPSGVWHTMSESVIDLDSDY